MAIKDHGRKYDLVVYGATGFTGRLTAEHITRYLPTNLRWAISGRNGNKLSDLTASLRELNPDRTQPSIELVPDPDVYLPRLAAKTRVLIATVGPYILHGEPAFAACAQHGAHYLDVSGETPFMSRMNAKYGDRAAETGAVCISQLGLESMPADVVTWVLARFLRKELNAELGHVDFSMMLNVLPSGGTIATMLTFCEKVPMGELTAVHRPFALSPVPNPSPAPNPRPLPTLLGICSKPHLGLQTRSIFGAVDEAVVQRTWGLMQTLPDQVPRLREYHNAYGARFSFVETASCKTRLGGAAWYYALAITGFLAFTSAWFRALVRKFVFGPGEGVGREAMKKESGGYRAVGEAVGGKGNGKKAFASANFAGGGYELTGAFVAQAAMVLLEEDIPLPGGSLTPACLGQPYVDRLGDVGFKIDVRLID